MISLQDEIKRFEKLAYNKQLSQFVTVDQMFVGGGITMQSIIHQNNFIVEQLKKMNAVFLNYCKLNQKVYTKIVEHELSVHSEQARLNALVNSIDRKLEDSLKKIKQLHSDIVTQNQKSLTLLTTEIEPVKALLATKVDAATFSSQMKKFLDQYDEDGMHTEDPDNRNRYNGETNGPSANSPYPRKKGKVGYDQFYRFREDLDLLLKNSELKVAEAAKTGSQTKDLVLKYIPVINTVHKEVNQHASQIFKLNSGQIEQANQLTNSVQKLNLQLNSRLNDQVWNTKFDGFLQRQIRPLINKLEQKLKANSQLLMTHKDESMSKFKAFDSEMLRLKTFQDLTRNDNQRMQLQMGDLFQAVRLNETKLEHQNTKLSKHLEEATSQLKKSISQVDKQSQIALKRLQTTLNNLSSTISQSVVKDVIKKFESQLKTINCDIRDNRQNLKQLNYDLGFATQQVKNIKDLLSRKANFTDIILHVQKKADRQDFKQLQSKFEETSQNFYSKTLNQSINTTRVEKTEYGSTRRIPSLGRTSKTLLPSTFTPNNKTEKKDISSGTTLFMCGLQSHLGDARKQSSQTSRRKTMKSSVAVTADFIL